MANKKKDPYDYDVQARNFATLQAKKYDDSITRDSFSWSNEDGGLGSVSLKGTKLFDLASVDKNQNGIANASDVKAAIDNYFGPKKVTKFMSTPSEPKVPTGPEKPDYSTKIDSMINNLTKSRMETYNPEDDPLYQSYKEQYDLAGDKAMTNTMSAATGITGGRLNSWAVSAGQQAKADYDKQLAAQIPALANAAYTRQNNDFNNEIKAIQQMIQRDNTMYNRDRDKVADERYALEQVYKKYLDEQDQENWQHEQDYKLGRDEVADNQWQTKIDIEETQNAIKNYLDEQRIGISRMNADTAAANSSLANQKFAYQQEQDALKPKVSTQQYQKGIDSVIERLSTDEDESGYIEPDERPTSIEIVSNVADYIVSVEMDKELSESQVEELRLMNGLSLNDLEQARNRMVIRNNMAPMMLKNTKINKLIDK